MRRRLRAKPRTKPRLLARKRLPRAKLLKMKPLSRRRGNSGVTRSDRSSSKLTCCRANSTCCNGSTRSAQPPCMPMPAIGSAIRPTGTSRIPSTNSRSRTSKKQWMRPSRNWKNSRRMRAKQAPPLLFRSNNEIPERRYAPEADSGAIFLYRESGQFLALCLRSSSADLLYVVTPMNQMKLPPLLDGKWTEHGMIQDFHAPAKSRRARREHAIHFGDFCLNLFSHLFSRQPPRLRYSRRFAPRWHVAETHDDDRLRHIFPSCPRGLRLPGFEHTHAALNGAGVRPVKMFENFADTPLAR